MRGYEIEIDSSLVGKIGRESCKDHLMVCEEGRKCPAERVQGGQVSCDCLACRREARGEKKKWTCPGHHCAEGPGASTGFLRRVVEKGAKHFPVEGDFMHHHTTERDNAFWDLKRDGSCGYEIVTPPIEGGNFGRVIAPLVAAIREEEKRHKLEFMSDKCGLHCTFDVKDVGSRGIKQILFTVVRHQAALVATQAPYRKGNQFCKFIQGGVDFKKVVAKMGSMRRPGMEGQKTMLLERCSHYNLMNLTKVVGGKNLIEFRFGGATTDPAQMEAFGVLLECLIDAALNRPKIEVTNNRKRRLESEVIMPYMKDERVQRAWEKYLLPNLEKAELARI